MDRVKGVYKRKDGRYQARYKKGVGPDGRAVYGIVYGKSEDEVIAKRKDIVGGFEPQAQKAQELNLIILGAGSHGKDVKEIAESLHIFRKISFLDDKVEGENIIGTCKDAVKFRGEYPCAFVAIGDNEKRKRLEKLLKECNFLIPSLVSPFAVLSQNAELAEGTIIMPQANVGAAKIGAGCIIAANASISSEAVLGDFCRVDTSGIVSKGKKLPDCTWVKIGEIFGK